MGKARRDGSNLAHPPGAWDGLLVPYSTSAALFVNGDGWVAGSNDHSGENPAQVYQYLIGPDESSDTITVP